MHYDWPRLFELKYRKVKKLFRFGQLYEVKRHFNINYFKNKNRNIHLRFLQISTNLWVKRSKLQLFISINILNQIIKRNTFTKLSPYVDTKIFMNLIWFTWAYHFNSIQFSRFLLSIILNTLLQIVLINLETHYLSIL